jgi:hypothetical protein
VTSRRHAWLLVSAAFVAAGTAPAAPADTTLAFQPASRVRLAGSTNVHGWNCATAAIGGELWLSADPPQVLALVERLEAAAAEPGGKARRPIPAAAIPRDLDAAFLLEIPVAGLDCGNRRMERDLRDTLGAAEHPVIRYRFERVEAARLDRGGAGHPSFELKVQGEMSLAGATRPVTFTVVGRRTGATTFRLAGRIPLTMTHFGVDPPTALLGLIQVHDALTVDVDLLLDLDGRSAAALGIAPPPSRTAATAGARTRVR